uniref:SFRICE_029215 n=1 Tax=Spodoptera frugiperda TaxID=7108 RepID=A0A2H1WT29_SPOFR
MYPNHVLLDPIDCDLITKAELNEMEGHADIINQHSICQLNSLTDRLTHWSSPVTDVSGGFAFNSFLLAVKDLMINGNKASYWIGNPVSDYTRQSTNRERWREIRKAAFTSNTNTAASTSRLAVGAWSKLPVVRTPETETFSQYVSFRGALIHLPYANLLRWMSRLVPKSSKVTQLEEQKVGNTCDDRIINCVRR